VLRATYPLVVELNQDFFQSNATVTTTTTTTIEESKPTFNHQLVHLVGHLYTPDQVNDSVFDVSYSKGELLLLKRDVGIYHRNAEKQLLSYPNITETRCFNGTELEESILIPFSTNLFIAGSIYFGWSDNGNDNTIRLSPDDMPIINSLLIWDTPPGDPLPLSMIANITNSNPKYHRMHIPGIEPSTNRFIYRPVSAITTPYLLCGDVGITYRVIPVPNITVSIVASLSCTVASDTQNATETVPVNGTNRSCMLRSYRTTSTSTSQQDHDENLPFYLIERGNHTRNELYQRAYRTTRGKTTLSLAWAFTIGILPACFYVLLSWSYFPNDISTLRFCGMFIGFATAISVSCGLLFFSIVWIVHRTALLIMIPLAFVSFTATMCLHSILYIKKAPVHGEIARND
jgi:hypothetical protein